MSGTTQGLSFRVRLTLLSVIPSSRRVLVEAGVRTPLLFRADRHPTVQGTTPHSSPTGHGRVGRFHLRPFDARCGGRGGTHACSGQAFGLPGVPPEVGPLSPVLFHTKPFANPPHAPQRLPCFSFPPTLRGVHFLPVSVTAAPAGREVVSACGPHAGS